MKFIKLPALLLCSLISLNSCSSSNEAGKVLRNQKSKTTDEFLIKKKEPLTQPPDFESIPEPGSINKKTEQDQERIKKILKSNQSKSSNNKIKSSTAEESILKQIKE